MREHKHILTAEEYIYPRVLKQEPLHGELMINCKNDRLMLSRSTGERKTAINLIIKMYSLIRLRYIDVFEVSSSVICVLIFNFIIY